MRHAPDLEVTHVDSPLMNRLSYSVDASRLERTGFRFHGGLDRGIADTLAMLLGKQPRPGLAGVP
jgi:hypothetical protein